MELPKIAQQTIWSFICKGELIEAAYQLSLFGFDVKDYQKRLVEARNFRIKLVTSEALDYGKTADAIIDEENIAKELTKLTFGL